MLNRQAINLIVLALLGTLVALGLHGFFEAHVFAQSVYVAQSNSVATLYDRSFKLAEGEQPSNKNEQSPCEKALPKNSEEVVSEDTQLINKCFYQTRDRYTRTRDLNDLERALKFARFESNMYGNSSDIGPASLKKLSLSLDIVQWLEEAQQQLKKEVWVPTIQKEKNTVKDYLKSWIDSTQSQISNILTPTKIRPLTDPKMGSVYIDSVYIQLNAARSLIRLMTNASIRNALQLSGLPLITSSCQSPSWESVGCVDQLLEQALKFAKIHEENSQTMKNKAAKAYALGYIGQWYEEAYKMQQNNLASKALDSVGQENSKPSDSSLCKTKVSSTITNPNKNLLLAQLCTQEALKIISSIQAEEAAYQDYQWQWQLGRIHQQKGQNRDAIAAYDAAVQTLNTIRTNLLPASSEDQFSFRDNVNPVYREYVSLLLDLDEDDKGKVNHTDEQQKRTNLEKARDLIESLQLEDLKNFLRCDIKITKTAESLANEDRLAAVIYPILLEDRLEVILSLPGEGSQRRLEHYSASLTKQELEEQKFKTFQEMFETKLKELRYSLEQPYISNRGREVSTQVYDWLIKPAEALIEPAEKQKTSGLNKVQIKTLLFIPDGSLRNIPMAALYDGDEYLIQKYAIAVSPRLQLLVDKPRKSHKALIAGLTDVDPSEKDFSRLEYAGEEVKAVESIVGNSETRVGASFQKKNLEQALKSADYNVVHLATHGEFNFQQEETFILSSNERIYFKDLKDLFEANNNVLDLLVLSACETASGDDRDTLGIAGMTVRTGARSAISTLWSIGDSSTVEFMKGLYHALFIDKLPKAQALQKAQVDLLTKSQYSTSYTPSQWASYILVGDWR